MSARGYMLRSARGDWRTPDSVLKSVIATLGSVDLDPCASPDRNDHFAQTNVNPGPFVGRDGPCETHWIGEPQAIVGDGIAFEWAGRVYVNPPFGDLAQWAEKCAEEARRSNEIILLLPARTDTAYWHRDIATARLVCFLRGRLRFVGAPGPCPFPTALAYWGDRPALFHAAFAPLGMVVAP